VIARKYIVDENNRRTAVLLDIATFEEMEELIENAGLFSRMNETASDEVFDLEEAWSVYARSREALNADKATRRSIYRRFPR
jgi:hypothetical protein